MRGVARVGFLAQAHGAALDGIFHMAHHQARAKLGHALVTEADHFRVIVAGVDMHQRERQFGLALAQAEGLERQVQHDDGVLAAREQQGRVAALRHHLADDVDRFRLELVEVIVLHLQQVRHFRRASQFVHDAHFVWPQCLMFCS